MYVHVAVSFVSTARGILEQFFNVFPFIVGLSAKRLNTTRNFIITWEHKCINQKKNSEERVWKFLTFSTHIRNWINVYYSFLMIRCVRHWLLRRRSRAAFTVTQAGGFVFSKSITVFYWKLDYETFSLCWKDSWLLN